MHDLLIMASAAAQGFGGPADIWASIVKDFSNITEPAAFAAFMQVLMIDLVLAGDNAIVVGALAAGLPAEQRKKVILIGVIAALVLRIIFALMVTWLLGIVGLVLAGGILLLWVAWRMYRDIKGHSGNRRGRPKSSATNIAASPRPKALLRPPGRWRWPMSA
jgi:predicted tellurium resistance membrane protein TerC